MNYLVNRIRQCSVVVFMIAGILGLMVNLYAASSHVSSSAIELSKLLNNIQNLQADFTQVIYDNTGQILQRSSGNLALARPGKFYWSVKQPHTQLIIADGKKIWIYDPSLRQVIVQKMQDNFAGTPAFLLTAPISDLVNSFKIISINCKSQCSAFKLLPKQQTDTLFQWVELQFNNNTVTTMRLHDNLDQETLISFQHEKLNQPLNAHIFNFTAPADVDVVQTSN